MNSNLINTSFSNLKSYIEKESFKGYDPYDTLNSFLPFNLLGKYGRALAIQFQKRNPLNIRPLIGIHKAYNPKGVALLLKGYSLLYKQNKDEELVVNMKFLYNWLLENSSKGYSGYCWGYNFEWASPVKVLKKYHPSAVVTSFVARGIFEYYEATKDNSVLDVLNGICDFILKDLPVTETNDGICYSYTDVKKDCCYNANMLAAETLARLYYLNKNNSLLDYIKEAVRFTIAYQKNDGRWNYSVDIKTGEERTQVDFHQGFVLESLYEVMNYALNNDDKIKEAIRKGVGFYYKEQFLPDGRAIYRYPKQWPVDIHNQAQGIISFSLLKDFNQEYLLFARKIADWTINHMQHDSGYFYYQKHKRYDNRIPYMRWSQAWMFLALATLKTSNIGF